MEAEDLSEWLKANHPEYDSLIVDEGGAGGGAFGGQPVVLHGESYIPFDSDQVLIKNLESEKPVNLSNELLNRTNRHKAQANLIKKHNPAPDSYHTWVRSSKDILDFEDTLKPPNFDPDFIGNDFDPSYTWDMAQEAIKKGEIEVYSSYPIEKGVFVTPSQMEAQSYAGSGKIYSKKVPLKDVAWIDERQGQYAPITSKRRK
jgi:hypothetical protein